MLSEFLKRIVGGEKLDSSSSARAVGVIMEGGASPAQVGAFLTAMRLRGESEEEIVGAAIALRERCVKLPGNDLGDCMDTCGTGGDASGTVNVSTMAALVAAGAGARVAKHGNRSVSSRCGSADLLSELGIKIDVPPEVASRCLKETGFAFLFAPLYHPAMKAVAPIRRDLGIRTLFNLIGPLCNPAGVRHQLMGVYSVDLVPLMAGVLKGLGCRRGMVVSSHDGLDEISVCAPTSLAEVAEGSPIRTVSIEPQMFKMPLREKGALKGGTPAENAAITMEILGGADGAVRDAVVINAAAALVTAGLAAGFPDGIRLAVDSIDTGRARQVLDRVRTLTTEERR